MIKLVKILLIIAWMGFIYLLSDIPYDYFPENTTSLEQLIAHIVIYFILAYLTLQAFYKDSTNKVKLSFFVAIFCFIYAISDEYHQGFVRGRFPSADDLIFDIIGSFLGIVLFFRIKIFKRPNLLLHICCAGCGAHVSQLLSINYNVVLYFYNPNIYPKKEYNKRYDEAKAIARKYKLKIIQADYDHNRWLNSIKGFEQDMERGKRCFICYQDRLANTAKLASLKKFNYFTSTLSVSPHKDAKTISLIGNELAHKHNVKFLDKDFKKRNGYKKSVKLSKELNLYRQDYCGCEFSKSHNSQLATYDNKKLYLG